MLRFERFLAACAVLAFLAFAVAGYLANDPGGRSTAELARASVVTPGR